MTKSQTQLLMIMSIGLISLGGAYILFYLSQDRPVWATTNKGAFVTPATTVDDLHWDVPAAERNHWWLWVVAPNCDDQCEVKLREVRATHMLLNKEANRVRRGASLNSDRDYLLENSQDADNPMTRWNNISFDDTHVPTQLESGVYIVDPMGNLVFRYGLNQPSEDILKDLKRLLKLSHIG